MAKHFIEKCRVCRCVINQCRCPSKDKELSWGICNRCIKFPERVKACPECKENMVVLLTDSEWGDELQWCPNCGTSVIVESDGDDQVFKPKTVSKT